MSKLSRIRVYLLLSAIAMVWGHFAVLSSGREYDPVQHIKFDLTRWVSDFAAVPTDGGWIKLSIFFFCVALGELVWMLLQECSRSRFAVVLLPWWVVLGTLMIGGLMLVAFHDMMNPQYVIEGWLWWQKPRQVPQDAYALLLHAIGFWSFAAGFLAGGASLVVPECKAGRRAALPLTVLLMVASWAAFAWVTAASLMWLPGGVPQRVFLLLIFIWVLRSAERVPHPSGPGGCHRTPAIPHAASPEGYVRVKPEPKR